VSRLVLLAAPLTLWLVGCATQPLTKTITVPVPDAQTAGQLGRVHKIAVADVVCPAPLGEIMASTVSARLAASGRFEVKDRPTIQQVAHETAQPGPNGVTAEMAAQLGTKLGVDAVLVGEASFTTSSNANAQGNQDPGILKDLGKLGESINQGLNEISRDQARMTINYRLIESGSARVLFVDRDTCALDVTSLKTLNRVQGPPTPEQLQQALADQFADKVLARLASPGARPMPREFAVDPLGMAKDTLISRGNRFAECGTFDEAEKCYKQAVKEKPTSHEALYNLGLLAESAGDLASANQYFHDAMTVNDCKLYIQAYQRTRTPRT
jgi:hypothetical protein